MIQPGAQLGILGGGQLGRMFTIAARTMGYEVVVLDPDPYSPAAAMADTHLCADYDDAASLDYLARHCAAVTTEFENVPASSLDSIAQQVPVRPASNAIRIARDRILEKRAIRDFGLATAAYHVIETESDLAGALDSVTLPGILKTATLGYDGKGQVSVDTPAELAPAFDELQRASCVLEQRIDLKCEISVVLARGIDGSIETFPVAENRHRDGILDISIVPATVAPEVAGQAVEMARTLAEQLQYVGVLAVEFFVDQQDRLRINEIAPRPHNSGHFTLDACLTDQFQQQVRTLCGYRPGTTELASPAVMVNLLGDLWQNGEPRWQALLQEPGVFLHLYGKHEARPGRKMGHFTCVGQSVAQLLDKALQLQAMLRS
jgi:5-(carboxyamino)imidazole ribonucleotide synthase